jgi:hypothetical protein
LPEVCSISSGCAAMTSARLKVIGIFWIGFWLLHVRGYILNSINWESRRQIERKTFFNLISIGVDRSETRCNK